MIEEIWKDKTPCLFLTNNRLEYSKKSLNSLMLSDDIEIIVVDNGSEDGTQDWLSQFSLNIVYNKENIGIAAAMNIFLGITIGCEYAAKIDNDTVCPKNWVTSLQKYMRFTDILQCKHPIIKATDPGGWEGFTKNMKRENGLIYNHFVGGSGIMFKRDKVKEIPETENPMMGWRQFQRENPELKKAFCENVEIELLDAHGYEDYPEYYKQTGRVK